MRAYIPDMAEFFTWMDHEGYRYVVLRGLHELEDGYPPRGSKRDVDMLVEDAAQLAIVARYGRYRKSQGVKCDIYDATGRGEGAYLKNSYFPPLLADYVLGGRRRWKGRFYVAGARGHLLSLIYHIAYQKSERSGIDISDPEKSRGSKYCRELDMLKEELALDLPYTLTAFHEFLKKAGYSIPPVHLAHYLQNDFAHGHKSLFLAKVCHEQPGEMNLFVIRGIALEKKGHSHLIAALREQYTILMVKDIPWFTRLTKSGHMRGGKWRRGGRPHIAVIVFDPSPVPTTEEDRKVHPFVFNARQFLKRGLREWFIATMGTKPSLNPIHSTDNEAEAVGHLPLFFSPHEQEEIFSQLETLRHNLTAKSGPSRTIYGGGAIS